MTLKRLAIAAGGLALLGLLPSGAKAQAQVPGASEQLQDCLDHVIDNEHVVQAVLKLFRRAGNRRLRRGRARPEAKHGPAAGHDRQDLQLHSRLRRPSLTARETRRLRGRASCGTRG